MIGTGELRDGMKVRTQDGHDLGKIVRFDDRILLIEKGFFFPKDYEIPVSLLSDVREGEAWLSLTKDELKRDESRWSETDTSYRATGDWAGLGGTRATTERHGTHERETERMTLSEEELEARKKRPRVREEVRVTKTPHVEERRVEGEVRREDAKIDRTDEDRDRLTKRDDDVDDRGGGILGLGRDDER